MPESSETPTTEEAVSKRGDEVKHNIPPELGLKFKNPDAQSLILTTWESDPKNPPTEREKKLGEYYNLWALAEYEKIKGGQFSKDAKGYNIMGSGKSLPEVQHELFQKLKVELKELHDKLNTIPPEVLSLLVRDISKPLDQIPEDELNMIIECIQTYDRDWKLLREPDPQNKDHTLVSLRGVAEPIWGYHGETGDYKTSIPGYILESARLHPEWKKSTQEMTIGGKEFIFPAYFASIPKEVLQTYTKNSQNISVN